MIDDKTQHKYIQTLREIIAKVLAKKLPNDDISISMVALPEWDSLAQVQIVVAIEKQFSVEADITLVEAQSLDALAIALRNLQGS